MVMIPCEYLWAWLASEMVPAQRPGNIYAGWISGNNDPSGAYAIGNFLDMYMADNPGVVYTRQAVQIYKRAQYYEYANFAAANGDQIKDCSEYGLTFPEIPPSHEQGEQDL